MRRLLNMIDCIIAISLLRTSVTSTFYTVSADSPYQPPVQRKQSVGKSYKELYNLLSENEKA